MSTFIVSPCNVDIDVDALNDALALLCDYWLEFERVAADVDFGSGDFCFDIELPIPDRCQAQSL